ncbi:MAG: Lrp/AsnC family transcriptional regulator [Gemmatimonadota bacterium]|nr:Lrp/AsnC family transcriptional regulator [Gemmatimonadota bacterium]
MDTAVPELDKIDRVLVSALQNDARLRLEDLARMVKLVPSSVHDRLRRLERDGVIGRWTIDVDVSAFGLDVLAYIGVQSSKPCSKVIPLLEPFTAIEECHSVAGAKGLMLKVRVPSTHALLELVEQLRQIPGVEGTETSIVLKTQFHRPIALPGRAPRAKG